MRRSSTRPCLRSSSAASVASFSSTLLPLAGGGSCAKLPSWATPVRNSAVRALSAASAACDSRSEADSGVCGHLRVV
eukprot:scaffold27019_cov24-Tisochrysis_lutea.AAC.2